MTVYFKTQNGNMLIEKGSILAIGGAKRSSILTGNDILKLEMIGKYKNEEDALKIFDMIIEKIINPTANEMSKETIYIDMDYLYKLINVEGIMGGINEI